MDQGDDEANVNVTDTQEDGKAEVNNTEACVENEDVDSKDGKDANDDDSVAIVNWQCANTGDEFHVVHDNVEEDYDWPEDSATVNYTNAQETGRGRESRQYKRRFR